MIDDTWKQSKIYKCEICGMEFRCKINYKKHIREHGKYNKKRTN